MIEIEISVSTNTYCAFSKRAIQFTDRQASQLAEVSDALVLAVSSPATVVDQPVLRQKAPPRMRRWTLLYHFPDVKDNPSRAKLLRTS